MRVRSREDAIAHLLYFESCQHRWHRLGLRHHCDRRPSVSNERNETGYKLWHGQQGAGRAHMQIWCTKMIWQSRGSGLTFGCFAIGSIPAGRVRRASARANCAQNATFERCKDANTTLAQLLCRDVSFVTVSF